MKESDTEKEAAMEAELKAARERAIVPLESRMTQFREMLLERGVRLKVVHIREHKTSCFYYWLKLIGEGLLRFIYMKTDETSQLYRGFIHVKPVKTHLDSRNSMNALTFPFKNDWVCFTFRRKPG